MKSPKKSKARQTALAKGFRSGLEDTVSDELKARNVAFDYEQHVLRYTIPARVARYTPDFVLPNGIIVETKGLWSPEDRKKMALVVEQHPDLDIRMVFNRPSAPIRKGSKTTYADVCDKLGLPYAAKLIPDNWLLEAPNPTALAAVAALKKPSK